MADGIRMAHYGSDHSTTFEYPAMFHNGLGRPRAFKNIQNMWNAPKNSRMFWTVLEIFRGPNLYQEYL
jgi:hypothetical protein